MLDFVFNLLIFFIITNTFVSEAGIQINRPSASTAVHQKRANVLVAIAPNGEVWSDGQRIDIRALRTHLQKRRQENPNAAVIVQADRAARAGLVVAAMDQADRQRVVSGQSVSVRVALGGRRIIKKHNKAQGEKVVRKYE